MQPFKLWDEHIKDLSYMNWPLKNIIVVDIDESWVSNHRDNVISIPEFDGDMSDRSLYDILPVLEALADPWKAT